MAMDARFNRELSYFPTEGKLDDDFNHDFRLVIDATGDVCLLPEAIGVGIRWKGQVGLIWTNREELDLPKRITLSWRERAPTVRELLEILGEEIPTETKSYSYSWVVGFLEDGSMSITDEWKTELLVVVEPFPWDKVLAVAGIGAVGIGALALLSRRPEYARRGVEYARKGVEYVRERIPARV